MDNKNLLLAIVLSIVILLGFQFYFDAVSPPPEQQQAQQDQQPQAPQTTPGAEPEAPAAGEAPAVPQAGDGATPVPDELAGRAAGQSRSRQAVLQSTSRVRIDTDDLHGSISLQGATIDDLTLANYHRTPDPSSAEIVLLHPRGTEKAYYAHFGWSAAAGVAVPTKDTEWRADGDVLAPGNPVTFTWDNGQGLVFKKRIALDEHYMFDVTQSVVNNTGQPVTLYPYGMVVRRTTPEVLGFYILHEGLVGVFEDQLVEVDYEDVREAKAQKRATTGGWMGITDKYWLTSLVPDRDAAVNSRFLYRNDQGTDVYQVDYVGPGVTVAAGAEGSTSNRLFAGAKEVRVLDGYEQSLNIALFDRAIDFGWFYFLTKPIFIALLYLHDWVGNMGVAIILLTLAIKIAFFPLANKSYVAMSKMKKLQPEITQLRERYGDDKMKLNQEMMALYKREKTNPASGCLPILIQIPVFFALYKVLFVTIEMRHAPFFGWIQDLSAPDPTNLFTLFGVIPWPTPDFMQIGIWPLVMGASMYLQQRLNPQPPDPVQAKIFLFLPIFFTFLLAQFPAGLVIYWTTNNLLSIAQQWVIMRRMGLTGKQALS